MAGRTFEDAPAVRTRVPLMVGLYGPSGGGKTYSALRLATGMQRIVGGEIFMIDTEAGRALHYADRFKFRHQPFGAPFGPLDYLAAMEHAVSRGASVIVIDSMSHEHEGVGGVLELHGREWERLGGKESQKMSAWIPAKAQRQRMINTILQLPVMTIMCFRSKEKLKIESGRKPENQGWMPIAGVELMYEMALQALLLPGAGGVPTLRSNEAGERKVLKLPDQFRTLFDDGAPLSEDHGEAIARWANGGVSRALELDAEIRDAATIERLDAVGVRIGEAKGAMNVAELRALRAAFKARREVLAAPPDDATSEPTPPEAA